MYMYKSIDENDVEKTIALNYFSNACHLELNFVEIYLLRKNSNNVTQQMTLMAMYVNHFDMKHDKYTHTCPFFTGEQYYSYYFLEPIKYFFHRFINI